MKEKELPRCDYRGCQEKARYRMEIRDKQTDAGYAVNTCLLHLHDVYQLNQAMPRNDDVSIEYFEAQL